ncbi:uncharacterized protein LOC105694072 [Athalia rosae]|uniref:uncharacterized protein LOC105694072 n=1 Tax=Athalia rosae TaxID=37344 RepID=UPI002033E9E8|nr:uncharacterized protein LOC105694072 [Athalia rosae]XP_048510513.1 uncharacterized protein LOC105694072 [Athalia rosae]XP_048510514.1 uncharacterized protein LOC105694072 [Athalia rosae]
MCRCNFRVKLDLSNFYNDVRRASWVYVNKDTISCICHLQKHIAKVFDIRKSFHLLLTSGEYLPPNEDARILNDNEMVLVVPGTGLQDDPTPSKATADPHSDMIPVMSQSKEKDPDFKMNKSSNVESSDGENNNAEITETSGNTMFLSLINVSSIESASDSKADVNITERFSGADSTHLKNKRKRVRTKKKAKDETMNQPAATNDKADSEYKKPKIIKAVSISNGKHIRFGDEVEEHEFPGYDSCASNDSRIPGSAKLGNNIHWDKPAMPSSGLANLLALRQSSTPITFTRKKTEEPSLINETTEVKKKECEDFFTLASKRTYPLMGNKARVHDVIAFKMLKLSSDYTPEVSEDIIARTIKVLPDGITYEFQILAGKHEIQSPQGKFDLEEAEETKDTDNDIISLSWTQLLEPRLVHRD